MKPITKTKTFIPKQYARVTRCLLIGNFILTTVQWNSFHLAPSLAAVNTQHTMNLQTSGE